MNSSAASEAALTDRGTLTDAIYGVMRDRQPFATPEDRRAWLATLDGYRREVLALLHEEIVSSVHGTHVRALFCLLVHYGMPATHLREAAVFAPVLDPGIPPENHILHLHSLHHYPHLSPSHEDSLTDEKFRVRAGALLTVTGRLHNKSRLDYQMTEEQERSGLRLVYDGCDESALVLSTDKLTQLVLDRPKDADRIADIILERGTGDTELIRTVLDSDMSPLSSGVL